MLAGALITAAISEVFDTQPPVVMPNATIEDARGLMRDTKRSAAIISDEDGRYIGMLFALDLFRTPEVSPRPAHLGGMATPYGVFLTNGEVSAGAGPGALTATGAMLFLFLLAGIIGTVLLLDFAGKGLSAGGYEFAISVLPSVVFFTLLRATPLSGTHGAEHMVVHAIERREQLSFEVVRRMPRVHPRCGTNLAIGAMLFLLLIRWSWPVYGEVGALLSLVITLFTWRPLGSIFQRYVTTKTPSRAQLQGAIRAGEELLSKYGAGKRQMVPFGQRLLMSGLPWVMLGSSCAYFAAYWGLKMLGFDPNSLGLG
jgi:hypothetical protein